jgi:hypothetical protein
MAQQRKEYRIL